MAGKVLVGGTSYTISGGKCLVGGTSYSIGGGITLINGTSKAISFGRLPSGFQEVEYIEASGTQYIDTAFVPSSSSLRYRVKFMMVTRTGYATVMGFAVHTSPYNNRLNVQNSDGNVLCLLVGNSSVAPTGFAVSTIYTVDLQAANSAYSYTVNSISGNGTTNFDASSNTISILLFKNGGTSDSREPFKGRIYYSQIYQNGSIARNYAPCYCTTTVTGYKGSTAVSCASGTIGMFDLVNSRFYVNSGSGTFTKGPDV